jgi:hypothetical protein
VGVGVPPVAIVSVLVAPMPHAPPLLIYLKRLNSAAINGCAWAVVGCYGVVERSGAGS